MMSASWSKQVSTREKPVGACTACGAAVYRATLIGDPCGHMVGGRPCRGVNGSRMNDSDWTACDGCAGSGSVGASQWQRQCDRCDGVGWLATSRF